MTRECIAGLVCLILSTAAFADSALHQPAARPFEREGSSIAIQEGLILSGAPGNSGSGGRVYSYTYDSANWEARSWVSPVPVIDQDEFGRSMQIDGDRSIVGAPGERKGITPGVLISTGAAYVLGFDGTEWSVQQRLQPTSTHEQTRFGESVSISGNTLAIGSPPHHDSPTGSSGSVHIYTFDNASNTWLEQSIIVPPTPVGSFGRAVSLHANVLAVGAPHDGISKRPTGAVYIYNRWSNVWYLQEILTPFDDQPEAGYGDAIDIDNNVMVIGANLWRGADYAVGQVYIHEFNNLTHRWEATGKVVPPPESDYVSYFFGGSVAIEGDTFVVGASGSSEIPGEGGAHVYRRHPVTGSWVLVDIPLPDDGEINDGFGSSIDLSRGCVAVGAAYNNSLAGEETGGTYVFCDIPGIPLGEPAIDFDIICCEAPIDPMGPVVYKLRFVELHSLQSRAIKVRVELYGPKGKRTILKETTLETQPAGEPIFISGAYYLDNPMSEGTYQLSVVVENEAGQIILKQRGFKSIH